MGYLNKHHGDTLRAFAETFSELGSIQAKRNAWSRGSYRIMEAKIVGIDSEKLDLEVTVRKPSKQSVVEQISVNLGTPKFLDVVLKDFLIWDIHCFFICDH